MTVWWSSTSDMRTKLIAYFLLLATSFGLAQIYTPGSGGTGGGGGGLTNGYSFDAAFFRTANTTNIFAKDGANVTNLNVQSSVKVAGNQTNTGGGWLVMEDGSVSTIMLYGNIGGPAILSSNANINFGPIGKSITFDNNGAGRAGYGSQPYGSLGYGSATAYTGGFDIVAGSNFVAANTIALKGLTASRVTFLNSSGQLTNVTSASPSTEYVKADGTVGTPSGSGTPAGNSGAIQFNDGGSFAANGQFTYDTTNHTVLVSGPGLTNGFIAKGSNVNNYVKLTAQGLVGHNTLTFQPSGDFALSSNYWAMNSIGQLYPLNYSDATLGDNTDGRQVALYTSRQLFRHRVLPGATIYGTNQFWTTNLTANITFADPSALENNIRYSVVLSNATYTVAFPAAWRWPYDGNSAPACQNGLYEIIVQKTSTHTNAWLENSSSLSLSPGWGTALVTNSGVVSVTLTNRPASIATNATSVTVDFSDAANIQIYNAWFHLTTNLVVSPTNLVVGRTVAIYFATNSLNYDVTVSNTAANPVKWNFNVALNGSTHFTKTNTLSARVFLTAETNGVISAEMGYYR